jgi:proteasome lid subunit RPN8/RPN11
MSTRTVTERGVTWSVRDLGRGKEEWVRVSGEAEVFRAGGSCTLVDATTPRRAPAPRKAAASTKSARTCTSSRAPSHVVLTAQAANRIREIIGKGAGFDREWGGGLFGYREGDAVVVAWAVPVEVGAVATPRSLEIRADRLLRFEQPGDLWVGDFHSHAAVAAVPSWNDRSAWAGEAGRHGYYVGLIATPRAALKEWGFSQPHLNAWITDRNGNCKPVRIEEERWRS